MHLASYPGLQIAGANPRDLKAWVRGYSAPCADGSHTHFHPVGIIGGKFLERGRIAKPKVQGGDPIVYYQAQDLYVGSRVELNRHKFVLIDTDEYALRYMEKHSDLVGNYIECNI